MRTTLDGQAVFDEQELTISADSPSRASLERSVAGLEGVLSIDLGARSRRVRQTGTLRAAGQAALSTRIDAVAVFLDGQTHTLTTAVGRTYTKLRMDSFRQMDERADGIGIVVEYEIIYTQLGD